MRWVTFDCFGTLVDWHTGFAAIVRPLAGERTADLLRAYHRFERLLEQESPHRLYRDVLATALKRAADEIGLPLSDAEARRLPEAWGSQPVFADVEPMLAALRQSGCRLAVLTNCDDDLFAETHRAFRERFDLVVTAERVRDYKPSLAHFRYFGRSTGAARGRLGSRRVQLVPRHRAGSGAGARAGVVGSRPHRRGFRVRVGLRADGGRRP